MPSSEISLARRIIQANNRLRELCLEYYRGELDEFSFRAERADILMFIDETGKSNTILSMPIVSDNSNDNTGTFPVVS